MRPDSIALDHVADLDLGYNDNAADFIPPPRPRTRGDCVNGVRPCPCFSCRHHLGLELVGRNLRPKFRELEEMLETCSLDLADRGEHNLQQVGDVFGIVRERTRQIEAKALAKLAHGLKKKDVL